MNSLLHTLERPAAAPEVTPVLAQDGIACTVLTLGADSHPASLARGRQLLFVLEGDLAVKVDGVTTFVDQGAATLLAADQSPEISARHDTPVRVLRVEVPPKAGASPEIITP